MKYDHLLAMKDKIFQQTDRLIEQHFRSLHKCASKRSKSGLVNEHEEVDMLRQYIRVRKWSEQTSHPVWKNVGRPLEFLRFSVPYELSPKGAEAFHKMISKKFPDDFVWSWTDSKREESVVTVMRNPSHKGLQSISLSSLAKPITERNASMRKRRRIPKLTPDLLRIKRKTKPGRVRTRRKVKPEALRIRRKA